MNEKNRARLTDSKDWCTFKAGEEKCKSLAVRPTKYFVQASDSTRSKLLSGGTFTRHRQNPVLLTEYKLPVTICHAGKSEERALRALHAIQGKAKRETGECGERGEARRGLECGGKPSESAFFKPVVYTRALGSCFSSSGNVNVSVNVDTYAAKHISPGKWRVCSASTMLEQPVETTRRRCSACSTESCCLA